MDKLALSDDSNLALSTRSTILTLGAQDARPGIEPRNGTSDLILMDFRTLQSDWFESTRRRLTTPGGL